jgi:hypothetical protein
VIEAARGGCGKQEIVVDERHGWWRRKKCSGKMNGILRMDRISCVR